MSGPTAGDPAGDVLPAAVAARVPPVAARRDAVLVTGPARAGVGALVAALRCRLPDRRVVAFPDLPAGTAPAVVVFVVSAAAEPTDSDCALLDAAAAHTDAVIAVVSKIDLHRQWPRILDAARYRVAASHRRYRALPWLAVAAAPRHGAPCLDALVAELRDRLDDPTLTRRNLLRDAESRLQAALRLHDGAGADTGRGDRMTELREQRDLVLRQRRRLKVERLTALRSRIGRARVQLTHFARSCCNAVRAELEEDAAGVPRRRLVEFEAGARARAGEVLAEVDRGVEAELIAVARQLGLPGALADVAATSAEVWPGGTPGVDLTRPAPRSRRLESRLVLLLGAGFGLGSALTLSRLLADLAPGLTPAGATGCAAVGLTVTVWVVRARGLLHDRALLGRWVTELTAGVRSAAEELVALRVLSAESALTTALARRDAADSARAAERIAELDDERRRLAAAADAALLRDRDRLELSRALAAVSAELG